MPKAKLSSRTRNVLAVVLAGGKGERLSPLTIPRAKPAVPFGGKYRIIDFTLSNCINANIMKIAVMTQYKSLSLDRHIQLGWSRLVSPDLGEFIYTIPAQQQVGERWYEGTADAVYQNIFFIEKIGLPYLLVLSGDHIYKMDYSEMLDFHIHNNALATIAAIEVTKKDARAFGVMQVDEENRIIGFEEKPAAPKTIPGRTNECLASMGIYLFNTDDIVSALKKDAGSTSSHDFGKNIIPDLIKTGKVFAYNFRDENKKTAKYWRDVGTLDAYWEANMDLVSVDPQLNLYDNDWPIRTHLRQYPPAKFVFAQEYEGGRLGQALDSIVTDGCIISGGRVQNSVLSPNVRINSWATVMESILMENVEIGRHCKIRRAIIDKNVYIPSGTVIGYDRKEDKKRFHVSPGGIVVVPKAVISSLS
ncbi:MAG: glucose-1-phosphate adenylyltransferase [Nitrospiraceae bacterium]|jgi:glucose-1-phosphate adenylyltransferase|nr:glucose-1-phosphate adenylyltransferase [Nitrospiraceae bacterium]